MLEDSAFDMEGEIRGEATEQVRAGEAEGARRAGRGGRRLANRHPADCHP